MWLKLSGTKVSKQPLPGGDNTPCVSTLVRQTLHSWQCYFDHRAHRSLAQLAANLHNAFKHECVNTFLIDDTHTHTRTRALISAVARKTYRCRLLSWFLFVFVPPTQTRRICGGHKHLVGRRTLFIRHLLPFLRSPPWSWPPAVPQVARGTWPQKNVPTFMRQSPSIRVDARAYVP